MSQSSVERLYHAVPLYQSETMVKRRYPTSSYHKGLYSLYSSRTNTKVSAWALSIYVATLYRESAAAKDLVCRTDTEVPA